MNNLPPLPEMATRHFGVGRDPESLQPTRTMKTRRDFSAIGSMALGLLVLVGLSSTALAQSPVPSNAPTGYPNWWFIRNVIAQKIPTNSSPSWPSNYPTSDDYSVVNQGQLKNFAASAYNELQAHFPSGVMAGSNAVSLQSLIGAWSTSTNGDPYAVVNQGQLKALASQFYNVLGSGSYTAGQGFSPASWTNGSYPWSSSTNSADGYQVANIGQAKYLFSFDLTSPTNQLPSWWSEYYFGTTNITATNQTPASNGLTYYQAYSQNNNPTNYFSQNGSNIIANLSIISGNNQSAFPGSFTAAPLIVQVTGQTGLILTNAPVAIAASGTGLVALTTNVSASNAISVRTDTNGMAQVYAQMSNPATAFSVTNTALGATGPQSIAFTVNAEVNPTNIAGLGLWFKADAGVTNTSGKVTAWADQSTNQFTVTQGTSSNEPTLVTNDINGRPAIRFNGGQVLLNTNTYNTNSVTNNGDMTMITVASITNSPAVVYNFSLLLGNATQTNSGTVRSMGYFNGEESFWYGNVALYGAAAPNTNVFTVETTTISPNLGTVQFFQNGLLTNTYANFIGITNFSAGINVGANGSSGSSGWQGDIAEILVFNRQLTTNELAQVGQYIGDKYGLFIPGATWPLAYSSAVQAEIAKHHWNAVQAGNYAAMIAMNTNLPTAGLSLWLRADTNVTTNSSGVTGWADQSGNYSVSQTNSSQEPAFVTNDINGNPALRFTGGQLLVNPNTVDVGFNSALTMITVASTNSSASSYNSSFYLGSTASANGSSRGMGYFYGQQIADYHGIYALGTNTPISSFAIEATALNTNLSSVTFYRNALQTATGAVTGIQNLTAGVYVGAVNSTNQFAWQGDIAEVLVYDHQLSTNELQQVNFYLGSKYGLSVATNLPIITPNGGSAASSLSVSLSGNVSPNVIHYTLDGSTPTSSSPTYSSTLTLTNDTLLSASFFHGSTNTSAVASAQFFVNDTFHIGIPNSWQLEYFGNVTSLNPNALILGGSGLTYLQAYQLGYNPTLYSTIGDGLSDALNNYFGYTSSSTNINGDGLSNAEDLALGINPFYLGAGYYFLGNTYTTAPAPNPSDTNQPSITLIQPSGATLLGH